MRRHEPAPVAVGWSGGKDSSLALHALAADPTREVRALVTTVTDGYERVSMHGVRTSLLAAQASALGLPLVTARIPPGATNAEYERAMHEALAPLRAEGVAEVVFGDLFLHDVRAYRERLLAPLDMRGHYPLWGRDTSRLAYDFVDLGFRAVLVCVDPAQLPPELCGRSFDRELLAALPPAADPCGERGEFHTFVHDGPIFHRPVAVARGEVVLRDGFWFCDLLDGAAAHPTPPAPIA